ncbi:MAG: TonB family protein [Acidobacteriota bacterium]
MTAFTAIVAVVLLVPAQRAPPRDTVRPGLITPDGTAVESVLEKKIAAAPTEVKPYLELAKLQESRDALNEAEATLLRARAAVPTNKDLVVALANLYTRQRDFPKTIAMLELAAEMDAGNANAQHVVATYYWERAAKDQGLLPAERYTYIAAGLAADDRALGINPDYVDALVYKALLLQQRAMLETDAVQKDRTLAEAASLRTRAIEIRKTLTPSAPTANTLASHAPLDSAPVRVGGNVGPPTKIKDARPVYPVEAKAAGISGVVILEVTIGIDGRVVNTRILRSIPALDQAATDAAAQWEFTPTELNGQVVPIIMTATVNFTLQ